MRTPSLGAGEGPYVPSPWCFAYRYRRNRRSSMDIGDASHFAHRWSFGSLWLLDCFIVKEILAESHFLDLLLLRLTSIIQHACLTSESTQPSSTSHLFSATAAFTWENMEDPRSICHWHNATLDFGLSVRDCHTSMTAHFRIRINRSVLEEDSSLEEQRTPFWRRTQISLECS